ncbi:hypothetical protein [Thiomicrorhabdus aquaedulcis]|uniref:hypothetical protein n=1 Tax=Thiomicrorhabdus aquaedulcis TaxID=2211106 RepID=UPI000FD773FA|nr:hypothetical protein [Thiomicrorhabdus aquaedulcis]
MRKTSDDVKTTHGKSDDKNAFTEAFIQRLPDTPKPAPLTKLVNPSDLGNSHISTWQLSGFTDDDLSVPSALTPPAEDTIDVLQLQKANETLQQAELLKKKLMT